MERDWAKFQCNSCGWEPTRQNPWAEEEVRDHLNKVHAIHVAAFDEVTVPPLAEPAMRKFSTGATRSNNSGKFDYSGFLSPHVLRRYARFMHKNRIQDDGELRDSFNWKRGIDLEAYKESGIRHVIEEFWIAYDEGNWEKCDEAACAILFNFSGWIHERECGKVPPAPPRDWRTALKGTKE